MRNAECGSSASWVSCRNQPQPVNRLASFLPRNRCFCDEIPLALAGIGFFHIGADRGRRIQQLPAQSPGHRVNSDYLSAEVHHPHRELKGTLLDVVWRLHGLE
jgi:hypothetical protein